MMAGMTNVLATDLDGTLIFEDGIHRSDAEAFTRWVGAGNTLVVNSGRSVRAISLAWQGSGMPRPDYAVAFSGAAITDSRFDVLEATPHDPGLLDDIAELVAAEPVILLADLLDDDFVVLSQLPEDSASTITVPWSLPGDRDELRRADIFAIPLVIPDPEGMSRIEPAVRELCAGRAEVHRNLHFLDVVPLGTSKGTGLRRVLTDLVPDHGPVYTLGDSWNDVPMHALADHPVAMAKAPDEVKAVCQATVSSAAELIDSVLGG